MWRCEWQWPLSFPKEAFGSVNPAGIPVRVGLSRGKALRVIVQLFFFLIYFDMYVYAFKYFNFVFTVLTAFLILQFIF